MKYLILGVLSFIGLSAFGQCVIYGNIGGKPPYKKALLKLSYGSFPVVADSVSVQDGKFKFLIPDSIMNKQPVAASITMKDEKGSYKELYYENFMKPGKVVSRFFPTDTVLTIWGEYKASDRLNAYNITRTSDNTILFDDYLQPLFKLGEIRQSAVDSVVTYVKKYPKSQYLIKQIFERRRRLSAKQLKSIVSSFSSVALSSGNASKLTIFLENKIAESENKAYVNLVLKDRKGNDVPIFDELKDVNLIIFWTSWCVPCRYEIPILKKLYEKLKAKGLSFQFTHISVDAKRELWEQADQKEALPWKSLWTPKESTVLAAYNYGLPSNHLITKDKKMFRIDIRHQDGIDAIWKAFGLPLEKFDYPKRDE